MGTRKYFLEIHKQFGTRLQNVPPDLALVIQQIRPQPPTFTLLVSYHSRIIHH